jgi:endoglucanase
MLMTWELYGEQIAEPERFWRICETKIALLEQAQDAASGGVYGEIPSAGGEEQVSLSATAEYAGVMAMYAYNRREEDGTLANRCQAEAQKACRFLNGSFDNVSFDAGYFALTQLFRLTAYNSYGTAVEQYLAIKDEQKSYTEYDFTLFGDLAYLSSTSGTDLDRSAELMKKVMDEAEEISLSISRNNYYISQQREYDDISGMLKDMSVMALVNYIITNHEYTSLQKNYLEYFLGRNPMAVCFVEGFGSRNAVGEDEEEAEGAREVNEDNVALFYLLLQSTKG